MWIKHLEYKIKWHGTDILERHLALLAFIHLDGQAQHVQLENRVEQLFAAFDLGDHHTGPNGALYFRGLEALHADQHGPGQGHCLSAHRHLDCHFEAGQLPRHQRHSKPLVVIQRLPLLVKVLSHGKHVFVKCVELCVIAHNGYVEQHTFVSADVLHTHILLDYVPWQHVSVVYFFLLRLLLWNVLL